MKKSFTLFFMFLLVFFITDRLTYLGLETMDKKVLSGQGAGKVNQFLSLKDSVNLLVFGSSRANHHINTLLLDSLSFNMGVDGMNIGYAAALISTLNKKEQTIIVHIDHKNLFDISYKGDDVLTLITIANREESVKEIIDSLFPQEIIYSQITNCYMYNWKVLAIIKNYIHPNYDYKAYHGYDPIYPTKEQQLIFKKLIETGNEGEIEAHIPSTQVNSIIDSLIEYIKNKSESNHSKLIFITSPTKKFISKDVRSQTQVYFKLKNIQYYDYSDAIDTSQLDYWKDFTHMSYKGANVFTKEIEKVIK